MTTELPLWLVVIQGLTTPVVAVFAGYIAWQQWRTATDKLKLDLFDRRLKACAELNDIILRFLVDRTPTEVAAESFISAANASKYLFDKDMEEYLDGVRAAIFIYRDHEDVARLDHVADGDAIEERRWARQQVDGFFDELSKLAEKSLRLSSATRRL